MNNKSTIRVIVEALMFGFALGLIVIALSELFPNFVMFDSEALTVGIYVGITSIILDMIKYFLKRGKSE